MENLNSNLSEPLVNPENSSTSSPNKPNPNPDTDPSSLNPDSDRGPNASTPEQTPSEKPFPELPFDKGPQFGKSDGWGKQSSDWLRKHSSSIILPLVALLILIGGIYVYNRQKQEESFPAEIAFEEEGIQEEKETPLEEALAPQEEEVEKLTEEGMSIEETTETPAIETPEEGKGEAIEEDENAIRKRAEKGEGVTHLARKALKEYLETNSQFDLTPEHKIYVEDYLKDRTGSRFLEINEEVSFSKDLIREAIDASQNLTQAQLNNLTQFANLVPSLAY